MTKQPYDHYHPWYSLQRWRRRAKHQLRIEPFCKTCQAKGIVMLATIADHVVPHKGNPNAFWLGQLQSLCKSCHDGPKAYEESRGYQQDIGEDGYPLDPRHPAYGEPTTPTRRKKASLSFNLG